MTVESILRLHGQDCPRVVLPSGRVILGPRSASYPGAMAIAPHTFHGGAEPFADAPSATEQGLWWSTEGATERDRSEMKAYFPSFQELPSAADLPPAWFGTIVTDLGARFPILVQHREDHSLPVVIPMSPRRRGKNVGRRWIASPHLYLNGNLCVADVEDWDADRDSIATVVGWAAHWHTCYQAWLFTGRWPIHAFSGEAA